MSQSSSLPNIIQSRRQNTDILTLGIGIPVVGITLYKLLPYINSLLDMATSMLMKVMMLGGLLTVGAFVIVNAKNIWRLTQVFSRWVMGKAIAMTPIDFMREIKEGVEERMNLVREKSATLKAARMDLQSEVKTLTHDIAEITAKARVAEDPRQKEFLGRDLQRKEKSLAAIEQKLSLLLQYEAGLTKIREIAEYRLHDLDSQIEESDRLWRVHRKTTGLADDIRAVFTLDGNDADQWSAAINEVNDSVGEDFANLDILLEDMEATIANNKIDGSVAIAKIDDLRNRTDVRVRVADPMLPSSAASIVEAEFDSIIDTSNIKVRAKR